MLNSGLKATVGHSLSLTGVSPCVYWRSEGGGGGGGVLGVLYWWTTPLISARGASHPGPTVACMHTFLCISQLAEVSFGGWDCAGIVIICIGQVCLCRHPLFVCGNQILDFILGEEIGRVFKREQLVKMLQLTRAHHGMDNVRTTGVALSSS